MSSPSPVCGERRGAGPSSLDGASSPPEDEIGTTAASGHWEQPQPTQRSAPNRTGRRIGCIEHYPQSILRQIARPPRRPLLPRL